MKKTKRQFVVHAILNDNEKRNLNARAATLGVNRIHYSTALVAIALRMRDANFSLRVTALANELKRGEMNREWMRHKTNGAAQVETSET